MKKSVSLQSGLTIGHDSPVFMVAEIGNNHQGDLVTALEMVRRAAECGVDAVKFQKRDNKALFTSEGRQAPYCGPNSFGPTYGSHRDAIELSLDDMHEIKNLAESLGLVFFASAWDIPSLEQMKALGVELLKIPSADMCCIPLLRHAAAMEIPIILSTGMHEISEIDTAVSELKAFHQDIVILHCNSTYPCPEEKIGLPVIPGLRARYKLPVGYSGHEKGLGPSAAAVAMGACVIERHFTLDKGQKGTDHKASLEPFEMGMLVSMVRDVEKAMLVRDKTVSPSEMASSRKLRKSIVFTRDLPAGHVITEQDISVKCPGNGVSPMHWDDILGSTLLTQVRSEAMLTWEAIIPDNSLKPSLSFKERIPKFASK